MRVIIIVVLVLVSHFSFAQQRVFITDFGKIEGDLKSKPLLKSKLVDTLRYYYVVGNEFSSLEGKCLGNPLHGEVTYYDKKGNPTAHGNFRNGLMHGRWVYWNKLGEMKESISWKNGLMNGAYKKVYEKGKVETGNWKKNQKVGVWTYTENGILISENDYPPQKKRRVKKKFEKKEFEEKTQEEETTEKTEETELENTEGESK